MKLLTLIVNNKRSALLIAAFLILFPFGIYGLKSFDSKPISTSPAVVEPTISPVSPTVFTQPSETAETTIDDPEKRLMERIQNRQALSTNDSTAKTSILSSLPSGEQSGILFQSSTFSIEYIASPDLFKVEILTDNINEAKTQAASWFQEKGMSHEGVCSLPLSFYLNFEVSKQMRQQNIPFNPLPDGC